jgi:uncharacterized repeat protein (TIGR02543 family)
MLRNNVTRAFVAISTALAVAFAVLGIVQLTTTATVEVANDVPYIDENGFPQYAHNVTVINSSNVDSIALTSGWYIVKSGTHLTRNTTLTVTGSVHIILENGSNWNITASGTGDNATENTGIHSDINNTHLRIYAQTKCNADVRPEASRVTERGACTGGIACTTECDVGRLNVRGSGNWGAGIFGRDVTINGGHIVVAGTTNTSGGIGINGRNTTINGGFVHAIGTGNFQGGAGIIAYTNNNRTMIIQGTANVYAQGGGSAAGIGGNRGEWAGRIDIRGNAVVEAVGGLGRASGTNSGGGAGIGGGGGTTTAMSGDDRFNGGLDGAGFGDGRGVTITDNATVIAHGGNGNGNGGGGAGIGGGGGNGNGGTGTNGTGVINISGGTIEARGGAGSGTGGAGAGIGGGGGNTATNGGAGGTININLINGRVEAFAGSSDSDVAAIGRGQGGTIGSITVSGAGLHYKQNGISNTRAIADAVPWNSAYNLNDDRYTLLTTIFYAFYDTNREAGSTEVNGTPPAREIIRSGGSSNTITVATNTLSRIGYTPNGWYTIDENDVKTSVANGQTGFTRTNPGDVTLFAQWIPNTYTVIFNGNGNTCGSTTKNQTFTYDEAQDLDANDFKKTGHTFSGWSLSADGAKVYEDEESVKNLTAVNNGTVTLYARWTPENHTITWNSNGGSAITPDTSTVVHGETVALPPQPTRPGFIFAGWRIGSDSGAVFTASTHVTDSYTIVARWNVIYNPEPPETLPPETTASPETTTTLAATTTTVATTTAATTTIATTIATTITTVPATTVSVPIYIPQPTEPQVTTRIGGNNEPWRTSTAESTTIATTASRASTTTPRATTVTTRVTTTASSPVTTVSRTEAATSRTTRTAPPATATVIASTAPAVETNAPQATDIPETTAPVTVTTGIPRTAPPAVTTTRARTSATSAAVTSEPPEMPPSLVFTVVLYVNGGDIDSYELETCEEGKIKELPIPTRNNHDFDGWFTSLDGGEPICTDFVFGANNTVIYARWSQDGIQIPPYISPEPETTEPPQVYIPSNNEVPGGGLLIHNPPPEENVPVQAAGIIPEITIGGVLLFAPFGAPVWSSVNLVLAVLGAVFMLGAVAKALFQKKRELKENSEMSFSEEMSAENRKKVTWLPVALVAGIISVFLFLIAQDWSQTMVFTDFWTLIHAVLLSTEVTAIMLAFKKHRKSVSSMREIERNALPIH